MKTNAIEKDDGYILNGSKTWITNAPIADLLIIWAKDEQDVLRGFIVDRDTKGLTTPEIEGGKFALRASVTGQIFLDNVFVPKDKILPDVQSFRGPFHVSIWQDMELLGVQWVQQNLLECCFRIFLLEREQFGKPLASKQLVQNKLADMQTEITLGLQSVLRLGRLIDDGKMKPEMISLLKRNNCQKGLEIARISRDIHGGNGISDEYHVIRHCMNLEAVNTYEGTYDIHGLILGKAKRQWRLSSKSSFRCFARNSSTFPNILSVLFSTKSMSFIWFYIPFVFLTKTIKLVSKLSCMNQSNIIVLHTMNYQNR